jgi:hypothetical protein
VKETGCFVTHHGGTKERKFNSQPLCEYMTELRHPEFTECHSPHILWLTTSEKPSEDREFGRGRGRLSLGRKLWIINIASPSSQPLRQPLPNPVCQGTWHKDSLIPFTDCELKLVAGMKLTPSE